MSSLCALCLGYESAGEDYIKDKCSDCQADECACGDCVCADCDDWSSDSETESEHECDSVGGWSKQQTQTTVNPGPVHSESDVESESSASDSDDHNNDGTKETVTEQSNDDNAGGTKELMATLKGESEEGNPDVQSSTDTKETISSDRSSEEEQKYPDEILQFMQNKRSKRNAPRYYSSHRHRESRFRSRQRNDSHRRSKRGIRHLLSKVMMPSRTIASVTIPQAEQRNFKCGDKTRLITLRPHGIMGRIEYNLIASEMEKTRRNHISGAFSGYDIISIQKIVNPCLWKRYRHRRREVLAETKYSNERMLFHGSPSHKILIENGFDERHASTTGMFGAGLYFARNSSKSNQYVFAPNASNGCPTHQTKHCLVCERVLILCRVILGQVKQFTSGQHLAHPPVNCHSVEGVGSPGGLKYSENIVYRGEQVYPEFLITYKLKA